MEPTAVCRRALGCEWGGGADLRIAGRVARWASSASDLERESIGRSSARRGAGQSKQCEVRATGGKERRARRGAAKTALVRVLLCRHTRASQPSGLATRIVPYAPGEGWQGRRACGQGKVEAEDVGAAGGEGGLTARAGAAVNLRAGARDVWRRGRGRGSGRAQSAVGSLHTCTLTLLEGDVIDEAACIDVRRIRLRAGTLVECTPGLGAGYGSGGASRVLSRGRCWDRSWGCDLAISTRSRCGARFADRACTGHLRCSRAGRTAPGQGAGWGWGGWWGGGELDA